MLVATGATVYAPVQGIACSRLKTRLEAQSERDYGCHHDWLTTIGPKAAERHPSWCQLSTVSLKGNRRRRRILAQRLRTQVEGSALRALGKYKIARTYRKEGPQQKASEILNASFRVAHKATPFIVSWPQGTLNTDTLDMGGACRSPEFA